MAHHADEHRAQPAIELPDPAAWGAPDWGLPRLAPLLDGKGLDWTFALKGRAAEVPEEVPEGWGFAPRGAVVEPGVPDFGFPVRKKDAVWYDKVADLYEQAKSQQWNATTDIPWKDLKPLSEDLERAVCQLMTFLAENEFVALYLPSKFIGKVAPQFQEVVLFLTTQVLDEARHLEVFTKRALANGGGLQYVSASTEWSLKSLLQQEDFTNGSFLLSVLGEGTFLELLRFIEEHAPDAATVKILHNVRQDEGRHVTYGLAHIAYQLKRDPQLKTRLIQAAEERAAFLYETSGNHPFVQHALAVLAGGGAGRTALATGTEQVKGLTQLMHESRMKRLLSIGFEQDDAERISALHGGSVRTFM